MNPVRLCRENPLPPPSKYKGTQRAILVSWCVLQEELMK